MLTPTAVSELIRKRRSIFPKTYNSKPVTKEIIKEILENANWAPTHKKTEPWRFQVFHSEEARQSLSNYLGNWYQTNITGDKYSPAKHKKMQQNPLQSACVIALIMQRDPKERLPEWEELAALACAVQNMWLTCTAYGIGSYWSSPRAATEATDFLGLPEGQTCYGLFYMGYHDLPELPAKRGTIEEKVIWK